MTAGSATDPVHLAAGQHVVIAGAVEQILRLALLALFQGGPLQIDEGDKNGRRKADIFVARFDAAADKYFFEELWREVEAGDPHVERSKWVKSLLAFAGEVLVQADRAAPKTSRLRLRALVTAQAVLAGYPARNNALQPYLEERAAMPTNPRPDDALQYGALHHVVQAIARDLDPNRIGSGALAMLRRLDATRGPTEPALHRLLAQHADAWVDRDGIGVWALIVHAMSLAAPGRLRYGTGLGESLFAADYQEGRMTRLLEARADELAVILPRAVRFLVAHEQTLDPMALTWFVRGIKAGGEAAERERIRVARDYYRAAYAAGAEFSKSYTGPVV